MKKNYQFLCIAIAVIGVFFAKPSQGQTAYVSLDTLQNGDTIKYCASQYTQVVIYKPTIATSGIYWYADRPTSHYLYTNFITQNETNNGTLTFHSDQVAMSILFFLASSPTSPNIADVNVCGDIFSTSLDAKNMYMLAGYHWSTGATTRTFTTQQEGIYSVIVNNGCGIVYDTALVISNHTNDANLGSNKTRCLNNPLVLSTENTNITNYVWSTGANTPTITVSQTGTYHVTTTDNVGCVTRDTMNLTILVPYTQQKICQASFDTISQKNMLSWIQHLDQGIDSIDIQKEVSLNVWQTIGVIPNTENSFLDPNSNPQTNSDSYRIRVVDSCGNRSVSSKVHTTITLLTSYTPGTNTMGFTWSHYKINDTIVAPTYTIYGIDQYNIVHTIGSVPGSQNYYNWNTPDLTYVKFFVGFQLNCGSLIQNKSLTNLVRSNYTINNNSGIVTYSLTDMIKVYPTLTTGRVNITTNQTIQSIKIYDTLGQTILVTKDKSFDIQKQGLYFVSVTTNKGSVVERIIVQ